MEDLEEAITELIRDEQRLRDELDELIDRIETVARAEKVKPIITLIENHRFGVEESDGCMVTMFPRDTRGVNPQYPCGQPVVDKAHGLCERHSQDRQRIVKTDRLRWPEKDIA